MEEPLMSSQTVRSMSPEQAVGLAGANANSVNAERTSFQVAQYLLMKKGLMNRHYNRLVDLVAKIVEWQNCLKYVFGVQLDLQDLIKLPYSTIHHEAIVDPSPDQLPFETIFYKCCQVFDVKVYGGAWEEQVHIRSFPANSRKDAARFLSRHANQTWLRYGNWPVEILIDSQLRLPRLQDSPPTPCFRPQDLELSRCITLREYLIWVLISRHRFNYEFGEDKWQPPCHKIWCLGSVGGMFGFNYAYNAQFGDYYPLVFWQGQTMYIDCSVREQGDEETGTHYVIRPPT